MIDELKNLTNFASFKNFDKNIKFSKVNLFYGYNGSGKTSFVRFLAYINNPELSYKFDKSKWNICINGKDYKNNIPDIYTNKIKIFNIDFVNKELEFNKCRANKISAIIGKTNIELSKEIQNIESQKNLLLDSSGKLKSESEYTKLDCEFQQKCTDIAREIRNELEIKNSNEYTKIAFKNDFDKFDKTNKVTEEDYINAKNTFLKNVSNKISFDTLQNFESLVFDDVENIDILVNILKTPIKRKNQQVSDEILNWIQKGISIHHEEHSNCKFCGHEISVEKWNIILKELEKSQNIDNEYEKYLTKFNETKKIVLEYIEKINNFNFNLRYTDFISDKLFNEYDNNKNNLSATLNKTTKLFYSLNDLIDKKDDLKDKIYEFTSLIELKKHLCEIENIVSKICTVINDNNNKIDNIDNEKSKSKQIVINYFINKYFEELKRYSDNIRIIKEKFNKEQIEVNKKNQEIEEKRLKLENQAEIINKINAKLKELLDINLYFQFDPDNNNYILKREIADNEFIDAYYLSEGEKNFVAFIYFVISLESSSKEDKKSEIIVIDDPISSLDSNKLFHIEDLLLTIVCNYEQVFFLTHNFYFFVKIRNALPWIFKDANNKKDENNKEHENITIFEIIRNKNTGSIIQTANQYIRKHISEYMDIISKLKELYYDINYKDEKNSYTANLIRRVLEIFLSFKCPNIGNLHGRFNHITKKREQYKYLWSLTNAFSHTSEISSVTDNIDFCYIAGINEIHSLFSFMKEIDNEHFENLKITLRNDL